MIVFIIGLCIGGFAGIIFTAILVMSRDDSESCAKKDIPVRFRVRGNPWVGSVLR
jgi:hypothetical protein